MKTLKTLLNEEDETESSGKAWHKLNPVDYMNIVSHYDNATKSEMHNGLKWYKDAHEYASTVAKSTGLPRHTVAGITSIYSPQRDWHGNMLDASRVARRKTAIGGKDQKPYYKYGKAFAGDLQKVAADRLLGGEHYDDVIKGQKTHAFAHLIDHGGDVDPTNPKVVIDRHAHSVASGARITDAAFEAAGLKSKSGYGKVRQAYIDAAKHINDRSMAKIGDPNYIHPHQVQAVTWLVRQRLNNEEDIRASNKNANDIVKAAKSRAVSRQKWKSYAGTWHPGIERLFEEYDNGTRITNILDLVKSYKG